MIQEHWLFDYQIHNQGLLSNYLKDLCTHAKAVDERDPISNKQKIRGYGGVVIAWKSTLDPQVTPHTDGSERTVVITIDSTPPICAICCYLPCRGTYAKAEYEAVLDEVAEIVEKFRRTHHIVLGADFNGEPPGFEDKGSDRTEALRELMERGQLGLSDDLPRKPTYSRSGHESQIDFIMLSRSMTAKSSTEILDPDALNTSPHVPIVMTIQGVHTSKKLQEKMEDPIKSRTRWDKIDITAYQEKVECQVKSLRNMGSEDSTEKLSNLLYEAAIQTGPKSRKRKKTRKPKPWSENLKILILRGRNANYRWKVEGKPREGHPALMERARIKKAIRREQRMINAKARENQMAELSNAWSGDSKLFHRLVKRQRKCRSTQTKELIVEEEQITDEKGILKAWTAHFGNLATPHTIDHYDQDFKLMVDADVRKLELDYSQWDGHRPLPITALEVGDAINRLNKGKACDQFGITAEHLQHAQGVLVPQLATMFNQILTEGSVPTVMKQGTITPIHKGGGKPENCTDNYRGVTVSSVIGKTLESIITTHQDALLEQNNLQCGFTRGMSPYFASVMLAEAIAARDKKPLFVATLDAMKAFDVVDHNILARKMFQDGMRGSLWVMKRDTYCSLQSRVKWNDLYGPSFEVMQGTKQGGIPSPSDYKSYVNSLLDALERSQLGMFIEDVYIGAPTCADDILLISLCPVTLQAMLHMVVNYANQHRYRIHPIKSTITVFGSKSERDFWRENPPWHIQGKVLPVTDTVIHMGLTWDASRSRSMLAIHIQMKIKLARRTLYSMMGSGMHGLNGLNPKINIHLYKTYVLPRLLTGLEAVVISSGEIEPMEVFQRKVLRELQHLSDRCANVALYMLTGILPIEAQLHVKILTMFGAILRNQDSQAGKLVKGLMNGPPKKGSWTSHVANLLMKYQLGCGEEILNEALTKSTWGRRVKNAISQHWETQLKTDMATKSSLRYITPSNCKLGTCHKIWTLTTHDPRDIKRAMIKAKILTGTYILQSNRAKFNQHDISPVCPLCNSGSEDRAHFLVSCKALDPIRRIHLEKILSALPEWCRDIRGNTSMLLQLILDCPDEVNINNQNISLKLKKREIEEAARRLCFAVHFDRATILDYRP